MKTLLFTLLFAVVFAGSAFAQDRQATVKLEESDVPQVIITAVADNFADATILQYDGVPVGLAQDEGLYFYDDDDYLDLGDFEDYVVTLNTSNGTIQATFDNYGELLGTATRMKNVPLPEAIRTTMGKTFAGWAVGDDHMVMNTYEDGKMNEFYRIKIDKDGEHRTVKIAGDGTILHEDRMHKDRGNQKLGKR